MDWSPQYALETLGKVARLVVDTPRRTPQIKEARRSPGKELETLEQELRSPRGETPRGEPEKRAKQRKLMM